MYHAPTPSAPPSNAQLNTQTRQRGIKRTYDTHSASYAQGTALDPRLQQPSASPSPPPPAFRNEDGNENPSPSSSNTPSSDAGDFDEYEEGVESQTKRKKRTKHAPDALETQARALGRWFHFNLSVHKVLIEGTPLLGLPENTLNETQKYYKREIENLYEMIGEDIIVRERQLKGDHEVAQICEHGRKSTKGDDANKFKLYVAFLYPFQTKLPAGTSKGSRGFKHDDCAKLLCPIRYLDRLSEPTTRNGLRNGTIVPGPGDFPPFMYQDYQINKLDLTKGWLRSDLLIGCGRFIAIGPSHATIGEPSQSRRRGNAAIHGIYACNTRFIAYCCLIVHFSLSSQANFYSSDAGGNAKDRFPYTKFYACILKLISKLGKEYENSLIDFWNEKVFGGHIINDDAADETEDMDDTDDALQSDAMAMLRQVQSS
ncbi:hypothetical protein SCHPADRAFT_899950 [Schizopora paradoxa]|uniref:Uncharacterized protein n=1 Tax=Schizopora paradoxa TaxID=27342 RepID=A0A0H2S284_9AGAM|nr:hypothetical protein SCHPADRAFT_899950 [Schizopora paradoxa]